jgi:hypothetical protein
VNNTKQIVNLSLQNSGRLHVHLLEKNPLKVKKLLYIEYGKCFLSNSFVVMVVVICLTNFTAKAQTCNDSSARTKLETIELLLHNNQNYASIWWNGWLYGYSAATIIQSGIALSVAEKRVRQDMWLGAATTGIGAVAQAFMPFETRKAYKKLKLLPAQTTQQRQEKLNQAERLLKQCADEEWKGKSWKTHAGSGVVNLGSGLITWLAFDRTLKDGLINFAINTAITEAQIWSQPARVARYYRKMCSENQPASLFHKKHPVQYSFSCTGEGLHLRLSF